MDESLLSDPVPPLSSDLRSLSSSGRTKTTPIDLETMASSTRSNGRSSSIDSSSDRPKSQSGDADSAKAGSSGFSKLLAARRNKKKKKDAQKQADELPTQYELDDDEHIQESRSNESRGANSLASSLINDLPPPPDHDAINLLTDDSEPDRTPPLTSHNSHSGFYTSSSPLIKTTSVEADEGAQGDRESIVSGPSAGPESIPDSERSRPTSQHGHTLSVPAAGKKRGISPGRRFKNAFTSNHEKKPSRDRTNSTSAASTKSRSGSASAKKAPVIVEDEPEPVPKIPAPIRTDLKEHKSLSALEAPAPRTPPHTAIPQPATTVTPPTPRTEFPKLFASPDVTASPDSIQSREGVVVSPSGNMISHRRVRSASAASHKPSKLSNSVSAMAPTSEENKASKPPPSAQQSSFFSSVFSAAQNAASSLSSSLNAQSKGRSVSQAMPGESDGRPAEKQENGTQPETRKSEEKKPMAVDTLGSGNLDFSHLDIAIPPGGSVSTPDGVVITKPDLPDKRKGPGVLQRDEAAARLEDSRAARAVTMAYEQPAGTSLAPPMDDGLDGQSSTSLTREGTGDQTTPSGSVVEGELGGTRPYRSGSIRSRMVRRRNRGSSGATTSTIGAIGASAIALGAPGANASVPRLTGFAVASKKRNRDFHQLFRSVPEDDYLIEDYSCALQREIILAGRIYISEGHICFSSNILGWVTTLVISFDEVVAIEKESTAMVFPNAIAIQTLHARHTFRSLLSRESTYDLMVNIWKINHPALKSSANGTRVTDGTGDKTEKAAGSDVESDEEDEIYDEDEEGDNADSIFEGATSVHGSEKSVPAKTISRQASGLLPGANNGQSASNGEAKGKSTPSDGDSDFPGPASHPPTEFTDPSGQYDKVIKDELIPAPLGKVYSYIFGPASGAFIPKFLVENQKSGELQFEGGNKGLTNESKTRKYSYIKPLNGSIGPKQTKCISTETLDFLDLEKAVLVTLSTQTPDVPSGNVFCTKTKYLFTWAANNQTRFLMTCTIEWSGKSWLKGPIEKGAIDGQTTFGTELVNALKAAVAPRGRAGGAKSGKGKGRRKRSESAQEDTAAEAKAAEQAADKAKSWGPLEPLHGLLGPVSDIVTPLLGGNVTIVILGILLLMLFFRGSSPSTASHDIGCPGYSLPQRLAAYEEMWRREESELWSWLEDRVGMDGLAFPTVSQPAGSRTHHLSRKMQGERALASKLSEEKMSDLEMDHAIRSTRERLDALEKILSTRRSDAKPVDGESIHREL
ncbi:uncharacterized protein BP01DRAFT_142402 [Aspergillus saccharolyticus JOP 1030-1]|uniref:VASt domain-containing protein n=1 Tax=Aspergillus saccharolyticus JOP 1030-1 TaxID=1450539 RepID=A0A318Z4F8_9EURO|nr:hypothetical protein BP01DRAFT_142402 [Aspergillus saccharolyticus JOP 1030-1]PYH41976.1 hypothetical protein BP01DRAFT_142402 [Aspergillus saccharolyticus JOP 1030-1]